MHREWAKSVDGELAGALVRQHAGALVVAVVALVVLLALALVARRLGRNRSEGVVSWRRGRYRRVLAEGGDAELRSVVRAAVRRRGALVDLARELAAALPADRLAALRLACLGVGAPEALRRQLASHRPLRRGHAALLLGRLGISGCEAPLGELLYDRDADVQRAAAEALARLGSAPAIDELIDALAADRPGLDAARIVEWLAQAPAAADVAEALDVPERAPARPWLLETLGLLGDARYAPLIAQIAGDHQASEEERVKACRALGHLGAGADALRDALDAQDASVRAQAARALGTAGSEEAIGALRSHLSDPAWWVRANCAETLRHAGAAGLAALTDALDDPDRFAGERAAEALALYHAMSAAHTGPPDDERSPAGRDALALAGG